jgi:hypothetical protein
LTDSKTYAIINLVNQNKIMKEIFPQNPYETSSTPVETLLHGESMRIPEGHVLRDLESTREQAFNGVTVAELAFPSPVAPGSDIDKRVALIDFGEDTPTSAKAILYNPWKRKELSNIAVTRSRYALVTLNYKPEDRMVGFLPLTPGKSETIGRENNRSSFLLGLSEPDGKRELSSEHATVTVGEDGIITIEDHSTNGTIVAL